ncbi:MAG: multidrug DMT transporter permease [Bacteroidales bacterium]|nr:multidrug DMT transporter permease [Bacteroidales bacterium]
MFIIHNYTQAVILLIITMLCWGSWANTQKLASREWPFQHFYWDYVFGILLFSVIMAFTLGSIGEHGRSFLTDLRQAEGNSVISALTGGIIFNFANILLVIAIDIAGMAVAFPVGIGLALVLGVVVNYLAAPAGNPWYLFTGVLLVAVAILLDSLAYRQVQTKDDNKTFWKGLVISVLAGIAMGFFYRFVAASMSMNFVNPQPGKLTPYTAMFLFSVGVFLSSFLWNTIVMYKPLSGNKAPYRAYFNKGTPRLHLIGILGGSIWGLGMLFSIIAADKASYAISYGLGQGATLVSAIWGVFIWKEFKSARNPSKIKLLLSFMFLSFILGLTLIIVAKL